MNAASAQALTVALVLYRWQPWGGLQRDAIAVARRCLARGHRVHVRCLDIRGTVALSHERLDVQRIEVSGRSHQARYAALARRLPEVLAALRPDVVVGFNKQPGLDLYVAADPCYAERAARRGRLYRWTPRHRTLARLERLVCAPSAGPRLLLYTEAQRAGFRRHHDTPAARLALLPPALHEDRQPVALGAADRAALRRELEVPVAEVPVAEVPVAEVPVAEVPIAEVSDVPLWLMLATDARNKGVDRAIEALAGHGATDAHLVVVGPGPDPALQRLAQRHGVAPRVHLQPPRDDVPALLAAADLLVHPARRELAGQVIVEALAAGLPVIASGICGYAELLRASGGGIVLDEPFDRRDLQAALTELACPSRRQACAQAARRWAADLQPGALVRRIVEEIEALGRR